MEDTIKIELLTPLTGNFTSRELERQWEEGEYEYDVYEGLPLDGQTCHSMNRRSKKQSKNTMPLEMRKESPAI